MGKFLDIINEGIENIVLEYISSIIKGTEWQGHVFLAGGAVRDEILGKEPKDIDLLVDTPNGGIKFAEWITKKTKSYKSESNPVIYPKFGTAKFNLRTTYKGINLSEIDIEAVMTRTEKYETGNRKPEVKYGNLKDDVFRRDLTVNSLLKDLSSGEIKDLTGRGISDIKTGKIRTPLDPDIIYKDDPLRMLRAIRFAVKYGWSMDLDLIKAIKRNSGLLKNISTERINVELSKILTSNNPVQGIKLLRITGLNDYIIPELNKLKNLKQNKHHDFDVLGHTNQVISKTSPELITRLAAMLHDIGKVKTKELINSEIHFYRHEEVGAEMASEILKRLKYPNDIVETVTMMISNHMRLKSAGDEAKISDKALRKLQYDLGPHLEKTLELMHADNSSHAKNSMMINQIPKIRNRISNLKTPEKIVLPINGDEIMRIWNLKPGKDVGRVLDFVKDKYMENPKITKDEVIKEIDSHMKNKIFI